MAAITGPGIALSLTATRCLRPFQLGLVGRGSCGKAMSGLRAAPGTGGSDGQPVGATAAKAAVQRQGDGGAAAGPEQFIIVAEEVVSARYLTLYNRVVRFPPHDGQQEGPVHEFDVVGHPRADFHYAAVFPYHSRDQTVTLVREYAQGVHEMVWCLPTGAFDPRKHASYEACARAELSEEARLAGGTWVPLMADGHPGIPEVKWCRNRFHAYLVLDPQQDEQPGARDAEEYIQVCRVGLPELKRKMLGGQMLLPSVATCYMALERIEQLRQQEKLPASHQ